MVGRHRLALPNLDSVIVEQLIYSGFGGYGDDVATDMLTNMKTLSVTFDQINPTCRIKMNNI